MYEILAAISCQKDVGQTGTSFSMDSVRLRWGYCCRTTRFNSENNIINRDYTQHIVKAVQLRLLQASIHMHTWRPFVFDRNMCHIGAGLRGQTCFCGVKDKLTFKTKGRDGTYSVRRKPTDSPWGPTVRSDKPTRGSPGEAGNIKAV